MNPLENCWSFEIQKGTSLPGNASNEPLRVKIGRAVWPAREHKKRDTNSKHALSRYAYILHMRQATPSGHIFMKFGMSFEVDDVINYSNFMLWVKWFGISWVQKLLFPIGKQSCPKHCSWSTCTCTSCKGSSARRRLCACQRAKYKKKTYGSRQFHPYRKTRLLDRSWSNLAHLVI